MNFKLITFLLLILLSSCGVKGPPSAPEGTAIPSYIDTFLPPDQTATSTQHK